MKQYRDNSSMLRRLGIAVIAGTLALGISGVASAHGGGGHGKHARKVVHHHYYHDRRAHRAHRRHHRHGHHRGHRGHHGHRSREVHIYHHDRYPVYERPAVIEHHSYPPSNTGHLSSGYGHDRVTPTLNAGSLLGAAIGGLLGSQVGGGSGKLAATAAGTVGGFLFGDHAARGHH